MKVNVCVNGTFRYPDYVRHYEEAGVLGRFYYAHRRGTTGARMGLRTAPFRNTWLKEYALQAAFRWAPRLLDTGLSVRLGDLWQSDVIRNWTECDSVEAVIGAVADRVVAHARARGSRIVGHPVTAHPDRIAHLVGRSYQSLGLDPARAVPHGLERRRQELAGCDRLLVDSSFVARSFSDNGFPAERIVVATPGVDLHRFSPPSDAGGGERTPFRVVCVATVTPRKAQHVLLQAWRHLNLPQAELVLVGPYGPNGAAVTRGFGGTFTHHPRLDKAALRDLFGRTTVFALASVEDGFAQAPLEAMACGVPVIVTENVGMADVLQDGANGFVVPAFDVEAVASRIEQLYRDRDLAREMGRQAAATARRLGGWQPYARRVIDLHRSLVDGAEQLSGKAA